MCGRYLLDYDFDELYRKFILHEPDSIEFRRGEVCPTEAAPVIVSQGGRNTLKLMAWGLAGYQRNQRLINARSETLLQKSRFSRLMDGQRCIIPATAFYEWEKQGTQKIRHTYGRAGLLSFAGVYETTPLGESFAIITMEAAGDIAKIHDRMPVSLADDAARHWINTEIQADEAYEQLIRQRPEYVRMDQAEQLRIF